MTKSAKPIAGGNRLFCWRLRKVLRESSFIERVFQMILRLVLWAAILLVTPAFGQTLHQKFGTDPDEALLEYVRQNTSLIEGKDDSQCTALHYAARYGKVKTAKWLIDHKADVNTVAYNQFRPMHVVKDGPTAKLLIQAGADLTAKDAWGKTPLQTAAEDKKVAVADAILASGYPLDLASALQLGKRDAAIRIIKDNPAAIKTVEEQSDLFVNTTPLGIAALNGDKEITELLLKADAPVNAATYRPNAGSMTALSNAVLAKQFEIAKLLCEAGADCNASAGKFYPRLLDYARENSDQKMIDLLIKHGAMSSKER